MNALIVICLLGIFAYHSGAIGNQFKGSSALLKNAAVFAGGFGYLVFFVSIVWSFWPFSWWQPIVTLVLSVLLGGLTSSIFQRSFAGVIISIVAALILCVWAISNIWQYIVM